MESLYSSTTVLFAGVIATVRWASLIILTGKGWFVGTPPLFVDFGFTIKQVDGLKFGNGSLPLDYYNSLEEAEAAKHKREAEQQKNAEQSIEQEIPLYIRTAKTYTLWHISWYQRAKNEA